MTASNRDTGERATVMSFWAREARALARAIQDAPILGAVLLTMIISGIFMAFPSLDLATSRLFYVEGRGFPLEFDPFWSLIRDLGQYATTSALIAVIALLVAKSSCRHVRCRSSRASFCFSPVRRS